MPWENIAYNTTSYNAIGYVSNWTPTLGLIIGFSVVLGLVIAYLSYGWFKRYMKFIGFFGKSFIYFLKGLVVVIGACAIYGLYWLLSQLSEQGLIPPEYYLYGIIGYFGISGLGWITDKFWKRMKEHRQRLKRRSKK